MCESRRVERALIAELTARLREDREVFAGIASLEGKTLISMGMGQPYSIGAAREGGGREVTKCPDCGQDIFDDEVNKLSEQVSDLVDALKKQGTLIAELASGLREARWFVELQTHAKAAGSIYKSSCELLPRIDELLAKAEAEVMSQAELDAEERRLMNLEGLKSDKMIFNQAHRPAVEAMRLKTIEECRALAKGFWLDYPFARIADADVVSGLCEAIADAIAALKDAKP